jgi:hypothetical protein
MTIGDWFGLVYIVALPFCLGLFIGHYIWKS